MYVHICIYIYILHYIQIYMKLFDEQKIIIKGHSFFNIGTSGGFKSWMLVGQTHKFGTQVQNIICFKFIWNN